MKQLRLPVYDRSPMSEGAWFGWLYAWQDAGVVNTRVHWNEHGGVWDEVATFEPVVDPFGVPGAQGPSLEEDLRDIAFECQLVVAGSVQAKVGRNWVWV